MKPRCPTCEGHGLIRVANFDAVVVRWTDKRCPTCAGDGYVEKPKEPVATK